MGKTQDGDDRSDERPGKARAELTRLAHLSQIAVSGVGVGALLSSYVEAAVAATGATRGFIALAEVETGGLELVAAAGAGWTEASRRDRLTQRGAQQGGGYKGITSRVALTGKSFRIDDIFADNPGYRPYFSGIRSVLAVPIVEPGERVRGVINLESDAVGEFTPDEEAFVQTLADLAALRLAMDDLNAREAALVQIGKDLSIAADVDALMRKVADVAAEILRFEDCSLFIVDRATRRAVLVATRGPLATKVGEAYYEMGEGLTGWVAENGQPIRTGSPRQDPRHKGLHEEFPAADAGAFLAVPILSTTGIVGVLRVLRRKSSSPWFPNLFTEEDERVLSTIASQVGAAIDNTQLFARLVQAERMAAWGEMSAMSSHMIGNRVFAIKGDLNELEHVLGAGPGHRPIDPPSREQIAELVLSMKRGIFRLEELLAEFRDFVRATALTPTALDANEIVQGAVEETFPKRGPVALTTEFWPEPLPIAGDPIKLRRAFSEIVENALSFQETGGTLHVTTRRVGSGERLPAQLALPRGPQYVCITFIDGGPGVPTDAKERIFRPFVTSRNRGMGLGLAIVKGIIEAHKGDIVEVGKPNEGACFLIYLPLKQADSGSN